MALVLVGCTTITCNVKYQPLNPAGASIDCTVEVNAKDVAKLSPQERISLQNKEIYNQDDLETLRNRGIKPRIVY
jgi:hypothetical protein